MLLEPERIGADLPAFIAQRGQAGSLTSVRTFALSRVTICVYAIHVMRSQIRNPKPEIRSTISEKECKPKLDSNSDFRVSNLFRNSAPEAHPPSAESFVFRASAMFSLVTHCIFAQVMSERRREGAELALSRHPSCKKS